MAQLRTKKIVTAGFMLAIGIILPFATAHAFGIPGTVFLPMHIPVFLCGFLCGAPYGLLCGLILPLLNSVLTMMPVFFPTAIQMSFELGVYGFLSGYLYGKQSLRSNSIYLYLILLISMILGRVVSGGVFCLFVLSNLDVGKYSIWASVLNGIPGIMIQFLLIPPIVLAASKISQRQNDAIAQAKELVRNGDKDCVVVKNNRIISAENTKGIHHIITLHEKGALRDAIVADEIIGKAAAMVFSYSGVVRCYGKVVSKAGYEWLKNHGVSVEYECLVESIRNRKGDGICPMEETVLEIFDEREALKALKETMARLSKKSAESERGSMKL